MSVRSIHICDMCGLEQEDGDKPHWSRQFGKGFINLKSCPGVQWEKSWETLCNTCVEEIRDLIVGLLKRTSIPESKPFYSLLNEGSIRFYIIGQDGSQTPRTFDIHEAQAICQWMNAAYDLGLKNASNKFQRSIDSWKKEEIFWKEYQKDLYDRNEALSKIREMAKRFGTKRKNRRGQECVYSPSHLLMECIAIAAEFDSNEKQKETK